MSKLNIIKTDLPEVLILEWLPQYDNRGIKRINYSQQELEKAGINTNFREEAIYQIAKKGTLYGIHFQNNPRPHAKLVFCTKGGGRDFVVDLRRESPNYKKWITINLNADTQQQVYVPRGFGHAFLTGEDDTHLVFRIDDYFDPKLSRSISYRDPELAIAFDIKNPILSEQDAEAPCLKDSDCNL